MATYNDPDTGEPHDFPDDATDAEILDFFNKKSNAPPATAVGAGPSGLGPGSGGMGAGTAPQMSRFAPGQVGQEGRPFDLGPKAPAQPTASPVVDPSHFTMLGSLNDALRSFNKGVTGGLWDPAVGYAKSFITGDQPSSSIAAEQANTAAARTVSPGSSLALEGLGTVVGPGKLSQTESEARLAKTAMERFANRVGGGAVEGGTYGSVQEGEKRLGGDQTADTGSGAMRGMATGAVTAPVASMLSGGTSWLAGRAGNWLPVGKGGFEEPPTSDSLLAGPGLKPQSTYDQANKLKMLETMQKNAEAGTKDVPSQVKSFLAKNTNTGESSADRAGFTDQEQQALAQAQSAKAAPIMGYPYRHPYYAAGIVHAMTTLPELVALGHGGGEGMGEAAAIGIGNEALHLGAIQAGRKATEWGAQNALDQTKRTIMNMPTTTPGQDWLSNPAVNRTLHALLLNRRLGQ